MLRSLVPLCCLVLVCAASSQVVPSTLSANAADRVFTERLKALAGTSANDCGTSSAVKPLETVATCGLSAFQSHKPFFLAYYTRYGGAVGFAYGIAADSQGDMFSVMYQGVRKFPPVAPNRHTHLADDNQTRIVDCIKPIKLEKDEQGILGCIAPVNREESQKVARQTPIDTTLCAVAENAPAFNNKMVRLRGHFHGNFEYSLLSGDGCVQTLWFGYGGGGAPPSLAAYVGGGATPGSEDANGKLILPVPVKLKRDSKFEQFEKQVQAMSKADADYEKEHPGKFIRHCVTVTFVGRIDSVSSEVHEFRKSHSPKERSDGLGFGQMGLFEAEFILQSVDDDAILNVCD